MKLGYGAPLFLAAFDHRSSFSRGLFGAAEPLPPEITTKVADAKMLVFEAFERAIALGAPRRLCGVLVDEQFGAAVAREAKARGFLLAMPLERSGQREFRLQYGAAFGEHVEAFDPDLCKVLVRYNPEGGEPLNVRQTEKLARLSGWLRAHDRRLLFELLVPATPEQLGRCESRARYDREVRPRLVVEAMRALQAGGVEPDIWKIEGLETAADCARVVEQARSGADRRDVKCIVLGRGANLPRVLAWLRTAASVPGFDGLAIGRTLWQEALEGYIAGATTRDEARDVIADRYLCAIEAYGEAARLGRDEGARSADRPDGERADRDTGHRARWA